MKKAIIISVVAVFALAIIGAITIFVLYTDASNAPASDQTTVTPTPVDFFSTLTNIGTSDKTTLIELANKIDSANLLLPGIASYQRTYTGGDGDEYTIKNGVDKWNNQAQTVEISYQRVEITNGKIYTIHYILDKDKVTRLPDDNYPDAAAASAGVYEVFDQFVINPFSDFTYMESGFTFTFTNITKTTDASGNVTYKFKLETATKATAQSLILEPVMADIGPLSGDYYFRFDSKGRFLNAMEMSGYTFNVYQYNY